MFLLSLHLMSHRGKITGHPLNRVDLPHLLRLRPTLASTGASLTIAQIVPIVLMTSLQACCSSMTVHATPVASARRSSKKQYVRKLFRKKPMALYFPSNKNHGHPLHRPLVSHLRFQARLLIPSLPLCPSQLSSSSIRGQATMLTLSVHTKRPWTVLTKKLIAFTQMEVTVLGKRMEAVLGSGSVAVDGISAKLRTLLTVGLGILKDVPYLTLANVVSSPTNKELLIFSRIWALYTPVSVKSLKDFQATSSARRWESLHHRILHQFRWPQVSAITLLVPRRSVCCRAHHSIQPFPHQYSLRHLPR